MYVIRTVIHLLVFLIGLTILIFNRQIGEYAEKNLHYPRWIPWFPRLNAIVIGLVLLIGGFLNLVNELTSK